MDMSLMGHLSGRDYSKAAPSFRTGLQLEMGANIVIVWHKVG